MLVVSLALAAVLIAGGSGGDAGNGDAAAARETPDSSSTPATVSSGSIPPLPIALLDRVNDLPNRLREQTFQAYSTGALSQTQLEQIVTDFEDRNPSVRVGSVLTTEAGRLSFEVFTTGEEVEVTTGEQTLVRRADQTIALEDLRTDELIMVVTAGGSTIALTIEAFGVAAP
jgi:hypothetical protein